MIWDIPKRKLTLTLFKGASGGTDTKILSNLNERFNISFSTSQAMSGAMNELNLKITGLEKSKMFYLATSTSAWLNQYVLNQLDLSAGYDTKETLLFSGEVVEAVPDLDSSDYSISIKAVSYFDKARNQNFSLSYKGQQSVLVPLQEIANKIGFAMVESLTKPYYLTDYVLSNASPYQHIREIAKITGLNIYLNNNRLFVVEVGKTIKNTNTFIIDEKILIGTPRPTTLGCEVDIRLDGSILSGQAVQVKSIKFPQLDSNQYVVEFISHKGDTFGNDWKTTLVLIRKNIYEQ